ncbi:MAG TPA: glycosyltransferase family 9 protein [Negativicutes bacterium]|nr:glycosyltransferase family 9 protein [Negativicutes bacterium]
MSAIRYQTPIHNILITKLDHLGDMLWATPALAALKFKFPDAAIHVVCTAAAEPILRHNPSISQIMIYDAKRFSSDHDKRNWLQQSIGTPDLAVCFDTRDEAILLAYLSNAPIRGGYFYKDRPFSTLKTWWRLSHKFVHPTMGNNPEHEVINNIRLLERLNLLKLQELPAEILQTRIYLSPDEVAQSHQRLESMGLTDTPLIMYNIPNKTINHGWPKEHIAKIAERLGELVPGSTVLVIAGPGEEPLLESIRPFLPACCQPLSGLSFRVWAGFFPHCLFSVSRDAGAVHVSAAMGVPVISIFEESWKHMEPCWEAWNVLHRNVVRPDNPSLQNIELHVEDVANAANSLWKKVSNAR